MSERLQLKNNVNDFLKKSSECVGNAAAESYEISAWDSCTEGAFTSPIEHMFYMALNAMILTNQLDQKFLLKDEQLNIFPQEKIGKYRVDFLLSHVSLKKKKTYKEAIIELDGHNFHDRDEKQRRYEKQRDRFLQSQGHRVFHFTGKEITDDPYSSACEVLAYLMDMEGEDLYPENDV